MPTIKITRPIERIEKLGEMNKFTGKTTAKTMRGWIEGRINKFLKQNNLEMIFIFKEILNAYNYYHPETKLEVKVDSWKGKSSIELIKSIDRLTIIKYQRQNKYAEPTKSITEVTKEELNALIEVIKRLSEDIETIETKYLSMAYSRALDLGHSGWKTGDKPFFSDRKNHNKFTLMLGALDKLGFVEYINGKTKLLNKKLDIQMIL